MVRRYARIGCAPANEGITLWSLGITNGRTEITRPRQKDHGDQNRKYLSHDYLPQLENLGRRTGNLRANLCEHFFHRRWIFQQSVENSFSLFTNQRIDSLFAHMPHDV